MMKLLILLIVFVSLAACSSPPVMVEEKFTPDESVQEYRRSLEGVNLHTTAMGIQWLRWSDPTRYVPMLSILPFSEIRHFDAEVPEGAYYLFEAIRGHRVTITLDSGEGLSYFADLFGVQGTFDPENPPETLQLDQLASAHFVETDSRVRQGKSTIVFEPRNTRFFVLRILPRLLEGGKIQIQVENQAIAQVWPVENTTERQIWSHFGDPRDGGARVHHGVDIFAPRGTPIFAPVAGRITRVGERELGGLSVSMMDDERSISFYFAHLNSYGDVRAGQQVEAGHIIGTVGNTGNAITTPPHLHLGIYDRGWGGAVDPWYFLVPVSYEDYRTPDEVLDAWQQLSPDLVLGERFSLESGNLELFRQISGFNPVVPSLARRDRAGRVLTREDFPIFELDWNHGIVPELHERPVHLRLVALRSNALGFRLPDGTLAWTEKTESALALLQAFVVST